MSNFLCGCLILLFLPLLLLGALCYGIYYLVYSPFERRKYAASGCPEPYRFLITKSLVYAVETACLQAGFREAHRTEERDFEWVWPREDRALLIFEDDSLHIGKDSGKFTVNFESVPSENENQKDASVDSEEIVYEEIDLFAIAEALMAEKGCRCAIVYRREQLEDSDSLSPEDIDRFTQEPLTLELNDLSAWLATS